MTAYRYMNQIQENRHKAGLCGKTLRSKTERKICCFEWFITMFYVCFIITIVFWVLSEKKVQNWTTSPSELLLSVPSDIAGQSLCFCHLNWRRCGIEKHVGGLHETKTQWAGNSQLTFKVGCKIKREWWERLIKEAQRRVVQKHTARTASSAGSDWTRSRSERPVSSVSSRLAGADVKRKEIISTRTSPSVLLGNHPLLRKQKSGQKRLCSKHSYSYGVMPHF